MHARTHVCMCAPPPRPPPRAAPPRHPTTACRRPSPPRPPLTHSVRTQGKAPAGVHESAPPSPGATHLEALAGVHEAALLPHLHRRQRARHALRQAGDDAAPRPARLQPLGRHELRHDLAQVRVRRGRKELPVHLQQAVRLGGGARRQRALLHLQVGRAGGHGRIGWSLTAPSAAHDDDQPATSCSQQQQQTNHATVQCAAVPQRSRPAQRRAPALPLPLRPRLHLHLPPRPPSHLLLVEQAGVAVCEVHAKVVLQGGRHRP